MFVFVVKQKTAYEMRISDWSSDVCSSDLVEILRPAGAEHRHLVDLGVAGAEVVEDGDAENVVRCALDRNIASPAPDHATKLQLEIHPARLRGPLHRDVRADESEAVALVPARVRAEGLQPLNLLRAPLGTHTPFFAPVPP